MTEKPKDTPNLCYVFGGAAAITKIACERLLGYISEHSRPLYKQQEMIDVLKKGQLPKRDEFDILLNGLSLDPTYLLPDPIPRTLRVQEGEDLKGRFCMLHATHIEDLPPSELIDKAEEEIPLSTDHPLLGLLASELFHLWLCPPADPMPDDVVEAAIALGEEFDRLDNLFK